VAALSQRIGGRLFSPMPRLVAATIRATGGEQLADAMSEKQKSKR
jgi:hypothetical protein